MFEIPPSYWLTNLHFVIGALSFFAFLTSAALYLDSWHTIRHSPLLCIRGIGFLILALWAGINGALEATVGEYTVWIHILQLTGMLIITATFFEEYLPGRPDKIVIAGFSWGALSSWILYCASPLLAFVLAGRITYQATVKLERRRILLACAMLLFGLSWSITAVSLLPLGQTGLLSVLTEPFGLGWRIALALSGLASAVLLVWAWGFLHFRLFPQLYLTVVGTVVTAFVIATMSLSSQLVANSQQQTLRLLSTNVKVFAFSLEELKQKMSLVGNSIATRSALIAAVSLNNPAAIDTALGNPIKEFDISGVTVLNSGGEVVATLGTTMRLGESLSNNTMVQRAFRGETVSSIHNSRGSEFPTILVRAVAPLIETGKAVGALIVDFPVDTAYLDRIQELTGLEITVYGNETLSTTTLRDADGRPKIPGGESKLAQDILSATQVFQENAMLGHERFSVAGLPLTDSNQKRIGAIAVGISETELLRSLDQAATRTFIVSIALIVCSLLPLYAVARVIARYTNA